MADLINAAEARRLATQLIGLIMHKIKMAALNGKFSVDYPGYLNLEIVDVLTNHLGYKVKYEQTPIYDETPYETAPNIICYKERTIISWDENSNNS